jgi:serine protease Do
MTYVIGSPYGLEGSFSIGYISGFRDFSRLYGGTILAEFIQTDAAINSGNSGGPVFNSQGQLIGIASRILTVSGGFQGLGFVVTINTAKQLLALEDRVWIGIESIFLNSEMISLLLYQDLKGGLLVERVMKGSPADKAGLRGGTISARIQGRDIIIGGDLILEFSTQEACHSACLVRAQKELSGMDKIPVKFLRGGNVMETVIDVTNSRLNFLSEN